MKSKSVFYFAYGSNGDQRRFRDRVGPWRSVCGARLDGYRLRFAASVRSEGGGGAVVDRSPGDAVDGVLFEIGQEQLDAMDKVEFDPQRNPSRTGRRVQASVTTAQGPIAAELYTVIDDGSWHPPSAAYLDHILRGLEQAGHPAEARQRVEQTAELAKQKQGD